MDYSQLEGEIWLDGEYVPARDAKVHVLTHTLHYGTGVFEGVRAYKTPQGTAIFRLQDHTARLLKSAAVIGMQVPYSFDELVEVQRELVARQGLEEAYIRPLLYFGAEDVGLGANNLGVHAMIAAWSWPSYLPQEARDRGLSMLTAAMRRPPADASMHQAKACGYYLNSVIARREAALADCDEALMLDSNGMVAEGTGENVFAVIRGELCTPPPLHCLNGITRQTAMALAEFRGYPVRECQLTRDQLYVADEVFLTGTAAEIMPVAKLDGRTIGSQAIRPVTQQVQSDYLNVVRGQLTDQWGWLTLVSDSRPLEEPSEGQVQA